MKNFIALLIVFSIITNEAFSQNNIAPANDWGRISFNAVVPEQIESISPEVANFLSTTMTDIVTTHGLGSTGTNKRFIIVPNIVVLNRSVVTTGEPMIVLALRANFITGDGVEGLKFATATKEVKGTGRTEAKAYINALSKIKTTDPVFKTLIDDSKTKLISYYNAKCDMVLKSAESLANQNKYDEAIYQLSTVPDVSAECFKKSTQLAVKLYLAAQERNCKAKLNEAQNIWAANPNEQGAQQAAALLNQIDPNTSCFKGAGSLINKINASIKSKLSEIEAFNQKLTLSREKNEFELEKERIKAVRDISVAYYENQPSTYIYSYSYSRWW